jgi:tetratricopeptide (TPR) repeat protein
MAALQRMNWKEAFEQLADMKRDTAAVRAQQVTDSAKLDELLALARTGGAFQRAHNEGIPEAAVRAIVERLGGQGVERDDLLPWLDNWIESARNERFRGTNEDQAFEAAWREANRRFRAGISNASAILMEEYKREQDAESKRQEERKRRNIKLLETAVRIDELQLDDEGVISKLREMAAAEGFVKADDITEFLFRKANDFCERGSELGENPALLMSIAIYRAVLEEQPRERMPLEWAMTQHNLGFALWTLGERESGTARLEEAVTALRAALEERTRARVPLKWAMTQTNLGNALQSLGERESGTVRLKEAVIACRAALEEWTRDRAPMEWAAMQNNLGSALSRIGQLEGRAVWLEEAVNLYRAALQERTRERVPFDWAMTHNNLGNALRTLGALEGGTAWLKIALTAYRAALEEWTRERVPIYWAITQYNLGTTLKAIGMRVSEAAWLDDAVMVYRAALEVFELDKSTYYFSITEQSLEDALQELQRRRGQPLPPSAERI